MIIVKRMTTEGDRKHFDEEEKILNAHYRGKLGKSWYTKNPKTGKMEIKPKAVNWRIR